MTDKATAIEKTLEILLAFQPDNTPLGTSELSKKLGFHKATASRILLTLAEYGFLQQDRITKQFSLGGKIYELGMIMADSSINRVVQVARPYVDALREELNETVAIEVWSGASTVVAYEAESNRPLRVVAGRLGKTPPVHAAAGARAILSVAEPTQIDAAFKGVLHRYTSSTITDVDILKGNLAQFKEQGFAVDRDELDIGISAVGAPIFDHQGKAIAAIVVLIPSPRFSDDPKSKTITELKAVSKTISGKFFYKDD